MNAKKKEKENFTAELIRELEGLKEDLVVYKKHPIFEDNTEEKFVRVERIDARIKELAQQKGE